jgi:Integrase core domain/Transposase
MSSSRHTEAQMIAALKQMEAGRRAEDAAGNVGVSKHTLYAWKAKYGTLESFNGKLQEECLNMSWFQNLFDARRQISAWRTEYDEQRPHNSLGYKIPNEFAREHEAKGFYTAGVGQEDSNAVPLPHPPSPLETRMGG